jgi:hypothetical protein
VSRDNLVAIGAALYARKCRGERIDTLERLPYFRLLYLRQREAGYALESTEYGWLLQLIRRPTLARLRMVEAAIRCDVTCRDGVAAMRLAAAP